MISREQYNRVSRALPFLQHASPQLVREFQQAAFFVRLPAGHDVFAEGSDVEEIALLLSGVVRVYQVGETGREITLYRFGLGESCILTANAILSRQSFPAMASVEQEAEAVLIPADTFRDWVRRHDLWRTFVFDLLAQRLASVMTLVDEVAFRRMDARLAGFLLQRGQLDNPIRMTHQELAAELGTSREVVSRILEDLAHRGVVSLARGAVEILDPEALQTCAAV